MKRNGIAISLWVGVQIVATVLCMMLLKVPLVFTTPLASVFGTSLVLAILGWLLHRPKDIPVGLGYTLVAIAYLGLVLGVVSALTWSQ